MNFSNYFPEFNVDLVCKRFSKV